MSRYSERYNRYIGMLREGVSLKKGGYLLELFGMDRGIGSQTRDMVKSGREMER